MDLLDVPYPEHFAELLTGRHVDFSFTDANLTVHMDGRDLAFRPVYFPYPTEVDVATQVGPDDHVLILCEKLPKDVADALRNHNISYITRSGHVFLRAPGVLVDYKKAVTLPKNMRPSPPAGANLLTTKRAQIIGMLLVDPTLAAASMRYIASATGTSPGYVQRTCAMLEDLGFLRKWEGGATLVAADELRRAWMLSYPHGLGKANVLFTAYCDLSELVIPDGLPVLLSGEQAVPDKIQGGDSVTLYVQGADAAQSFKRTNRFAGSPTGRFQARVELRNKYWDIEHENLSMINYGKHSLARVPELFIAADLSCSGDSRLREVADQMIREMDTYLHH